MSPIEIAKFWTAITSKFPRFWHDLKLLPDAYLLMNLAKQIAPRVEFLSSPDPLCYAGKFQWCERHFQGIPLHLTVEKQEFSRPGRLLIDDREETVEKWRKNGGDAILFPALWNSAHDKAPFGVIYYLACEIQRLAMKQQECLNPFPRRIFGSEILADYIAKHSSPQATPVS